MIGLENEWSKMMKTSMLPAVSRPKIPTSPKVKVPMISNYDKRAKEYKRINNENEVILKRLQMGTSNFNFI